MFLATTAANQQQQQQHHQYQLLDRHAGIAPRLQLPPATSEARGSMAQSYAIHKLSIASSIKW